MSFETSIADQKKALRKEARWLRNEHFIDDSWLHILESKEFAGVTHVASYISYGVEPQTRDLNQALVESGRTVLVPRLLKDNDLEWVPWSGESEPMGSPIQDELLIQAVILPALRVDREGNRLGQGGGSYDRALARLHAWTIALVHHGELTSETIPHEEHDRTIDAAATPDLVVRFN